MVKKVWDKDRFEKRNRCDDCGMPCIAFYCPECIQKRITKEMKGRVPHDANGQKYGQDQDKNLMIDRIRTTTGQRLFRISYNGQETLLTLRTSIDLINKLGKLITDEFTDMMLVFMKEK